MNKQGYVTKEINLHTLYDQRTNNTFRLGDVELGPIFWLTNTNAATKRRRLSARLNQNANVG